MGKSLTEKNIGIQRLFVTVIAGIVLIAIVAFIFAFFYQRSLQRDAARLDVIRRAEQAFQKVYLRSGSYQAVAKDGCNNNGAALSTCNFLSVSVDASDFRDPGKFGMTMTKAPGNDGYEVAFALERRHGSLAKGPHTLTPQGIR